MFDYSTKLVSELKTLGLPVYHEHFLTDKTPLPCISYLFMNDIQQETAEYFGYSDVYFHIKCWAKTPKELSENAIKIDELMRSLGFKRTSLNELWYDGIGQKAITYKAKSYYNTEV